MRVLLVEDEHRLANSIKRGLEQESYAVDLAFDGETGFDLAATENYDLIILDLMLPKLDGLTICRKLRQDENVHTPILILTARGSVDDKVSGLNSGADDYLAKPFAFTELLARLKALSRRPRQTLDPVLKIGNLSLNPQTFDVIRNNKSIKLSKKEFALLEYFLRNPGKTLTKDALINHVWDYNSDILPNTVEVYIGYLRNKLEKPFPNLPPVIKTVRGFGYKIEALDN